jgi:cyclase
MNRISDLLRYVMSILALCLILSCINSLYSQEKDIPENVAFKITDGVYVHERWGANMTISSGKDGLLIIDTGYPGSAVYSDSIIREGFQKPVKYVVNTHMHFDHVGGNNRFSEEGAIIVAHENTRKRLLKGWNPPEIPEAPELKYPTIPPYPEEYLPDLCFYDSVHIHINDQHIDCIHIPDGHSDCDVVVVFRNKNIIHTGDLFLSNSFPPIEGTTQGYLAAVEHIIGMCDENTIVIPGHGPISNKDGLSKYHEMLSVAANRINTLKSEGKNLQEIIDSNPLEGLLQGESYAPEKLFIYCVYNDGIKY